MKRRRQQMGTILIMAFLMVIIGTVSGWTEATKYTLTLTDNGIGILDGGAVVLTVYDSNSGIAALNNSPSNPVKFELAPGEYKVKVTVKFDEGEASKIIGPITLNENKIITFP